MSIDVHTLPAEAGLPSAFVLNAWDGNHTVTGAVASRPGAFALQWQPPVTQLMRPEAAADPKNFRDPRVGWGLVLPYRPDVDAAAQARAEDVEPPLRELLASRGPGAKVLRYRSDYGVLALFEADGAIIPIAGAKDGTAHGALPDYLLLAGEPDVLPWSLQYTLGASRCVGRLHLTGIALERHVAALVADWPDSRARYEAPVVWAVDHGGGDISSLMRRTIAEPIVERFRQDGEMQDALFLNGGVDPQSATVPQLHAGLAQRRPAVVITTSHGLTGPLTDPSAMGAGLGLPVGQAHDIARPDGLLEDWEPDGAIWYAQACCSAGSNAPSEYEGLLAPDSDADEVLRGVAALGAHVAPLPTALLGAPRPLRAFIGHVEPTFDWTISFPWVPTPLTASIQGAVYEGICSGEPIGLAMRRTWKHIGELRQAHAAVIRYFDASPTERSRVLTAATYLRLAAGDRAATVLLGDPAASVRLPAQRA